MARGRRPSFPTPDNALLNKTLPRTPDKTLSRTPDKTLLRTPDKTLPRTPPKTPPRTCLAKVVDDPFSAFDSGALTDTVSSPTCSQTSPTQSPHAISPNQRAPEVTYELQVFKDDASVMPADDNASFESIGNDTDSAGEEDDTDSAGSVGDMNMESMQELQFFAPNIAAEIQDTQETLKQGDEEPKEPKETADVFLGTIEGTPPPSAVIAEDLMNDVLFSN
jgi:hypothetical protein